MPGNRAIYDQALNEGNSAAWEQQWDDAIAAYARALDEFPDDSSVMSSLGLALLAKNKWEQALAVYQRAAQLNPEDPLPLEKCGEILQRLGKFTESAQAYYLGAEAYVARRDVSKAIENWNHATELNPDHFQAFMRLALAFERTGKNTDASNGYVAVARILQQQGEMQKALQTAQRAAQLDPRNGSALKAVELIQKGIPLPSPERPKQSTAQSQPAPALAFTSLEDLGETPKSQSSANDKKASPLEDGRQLAISQLADLMFEMGDISEPESEGGLSGLFKKAASDPFKNVKSETRMQLLSFLTQAIEAQSKNDAVTALSFWEKAQRSGMEHGALNILIGAAYYDGRKYKDAMKQFQGAIGHKDFAPAALYGLGMCYGRGEKMKEAVDHLLRCLQAIDETTVAPHQVDALAALYESFQEGLRENQSTEEFTRIAETLARFLSGPNWLERVKETRQMLNAQQENGMLAPLAEMISVPGAERVMESMALIERYVARKRYQSALDEAHRAVEYSPTYLPIHMKMGEILALENRTDAALAKFTVVADLYRIRGESSRAAKIYEEMAQLVPADLTIRQKLVQMSQSQGNNLEAIRHMIEMASIHVSLADFDAARQVLNSALLLAQAPGMDKKVAHQVLHKLAEIDLQRLDLRQALKTYEQIKSQNPNDDVARVALVGLYFRMGNTRQAMAEIDDVLRLLIPTVGLEKPIQILESLLVEHDDVNLRQRLARLYQQIGRKTDAIAQYDSMADSFYQAGNRLEAVKVVQAIIALQPDNLEDYEQLLSQLQSSA
jgi:tetratricopeptide (TPR) repeat protein